MTEKTKTELTIDGIRPDQYHLVKYPIRFKEWESGPFRGLKIALVKTYDYLLYLTIVIIAYTISKVLFQTSYRGRRHFKGLKRGLILANHSLFLDPPYMSTYIFPRQCYFLINLQNATTFFLRSLLRHVKCIPIYRGDRKEESYQFIDKCLEKEFVQIYPEGHMTHMANTLISFKPGAFELAIRNNVPSVPLIITKRYRYIFGKRISGLPKIDMEALEPVYPDAFKPETGNEEEWAHAMMEYTEKLMQGKLDEYREQYNLGEKGHRKEK